MKNNEATYSKEKPNLFILYCFLMPLITLQIKNSLMCILFFWQPFAKNEKTVFQFSMYGSCTSIWPDAVIKVLKDLGYVNKMGQVSMDEFNVNWSLVDNVAIHGKKEKSNGPDLVNIGSCGIHIVHGSLGKASKETDWNLEN